MKTSTTERTRQSPVLSVDDDDYVPVLHDKNRTGVDTKTETGSPETSTKTEQGYIRGHE